MSSGDALSLTPSCYATNLHQTVQQPHCTIFDPTHPTQEINEAFSVSSASNQQYQPFVSMDPPGPCTPHQGSYPQSVSMSPSLFGTPPHPHFAQPHIHGGNSWGVLPSQDPSSTLLDPDPISSGWNAAYSHLKPEQTSRSRLPQSCAGMLISAQADSCQPRGDCFWPQDNTFADSSRFSHRTHHSQTFDSTFPNYFISHLAQGVSDSESLYPLFSPVC